MSAKKLTILFTPLDGWGHINACHGLAEELRDRGHRVVFAIDRAFEGKLIPYGFEERIHGLKDPTGEYWPQFVEEYGKYLSLEPIEVAKNFFLNGQKKMFADLKERDEQFKAIIDSVKPDVIINDGYICSPTLTNSGIPWVWLFSAAPHSCLNDQRIPPPSSGFPLKSDRKQWHEFREEMKQVFGTFKEEINEYCVKNGAPELPMDDLRLHPESKTLNIYMFPQELDYKEIQPLPSNWKRVESFVRTTNEKFSIPESLRNRSGKLVFLSMGSFACGDIKLMTRLTTILGKSKHRFIVSKGPHNYNLPENMFGERFLPQTAILPLVDLVITHGGNNTVTETFFYGKPMLVLPLFCDQLDNAQRIDETGLGIRLSPFHCTDNELLNAVDKLVNDKALAESMRRIGERIRNNDDKKVISSLIENIV